MTKPRFDPNIIKQTETSGGQLQPVDFMRPVANSEPAVQAASTVNEKPVARQTEPKPIASASDEESQRPSLSPRRKSKARVLVPVRLLEETDERLRRFVQENDLYLQDVAEVAIIEFLDNHGAA